MMACRICGKNSMSDYCFRHKPIKPLARKSIKKQNSSVKDKNDTLLMHEFFMSIWKKRPHRSEISGERLFSPPSSAYFHHIIPKQSCEEGKFDEENIIILSINEHANVEADMYRYEEINIRREKLKTKYNLS